MLALAAHFDWEIWLMDVKMAFLNGNLTEGMYMIQPEVFYDLNILNKVWKFCIYGLKQARQSWNILFDEVVKSFGFIKSSKILVCTRSLVGAQWHFYYYM
jgi:hypothetical protein